MKLVIGLTMFLSLSAFAQENSYQVAKDLALKCLKNTAKIELNSLSSTSNSSFLTVKGEEVKTLDSYGEGERLTAVYQIVGPKIIMLAINGQIDNQSFILAGLSQSKKCQTDL